MWSKEGETEFQEEEGDLDPEQVRQGGEDEMKYLVQDAWDVRVRFLARSDVESRENAASFRAWSTREKTRTGPERSVKLVFIDMKKAHFNACDEEEWVKLLDELKKFGKYAKLKRWLYGLGKAASRWER